MSKLHKFNELVSSFDQKVDFVLVYIREAHAEEEWQMKTNYMQSAAHKTLEDRQESAQTFKELFDPKCDIYLDSMDDCLLKWYGAYPERIYAILDGIIIYQGSPGPQGYDIEGFGKWLQDYVSKQ